MNITNQHGHRITIPTKHRKKVRDLISTNGDVDGYLQKFALGGTVSDTNQKVIASAYANGGQIGSMIGTGLGIAAGALIPGAQPLMPVLASAGGQLGGFVGGQIDKPNQSQVQQPYMNPVLPYAQGGQVNQQMINVEGQELEVDTNGNVIKDFKNKPPHPVNGINPDGNIMAKEGNTIIPVKHRTKYLKGDKKTRLGLINQLSILQKAREANNTQQYSNQQVPVAEGGYTVGPKKQGYYNFNDPYNQKQNYITTDPREQSNNDMFLNNGNSGKVYLQNGEIYKPSSYNGGVPYSVANTTSKVGLQYNPNPRQLMNNNSMSMGNKGGYQIPTDNTSYFNPNFKGDFATGKSSDGGTPTDWTNITDNTVPYIGDAAQLAYNTFSKPRWQDRMVNKEYAKSVDLMSNRRYNVSPQLNMNRQGYATANYLTRNASGGNAGMYLNQMSANTNNFNQANSQAWAMKQNADNGYMGEEAQFRAGLGAQDTAYGYQNQTDKLESQANRRNNIFAATQDIGQNYQKMQSIKNMRKYYRYTDNSNNSSFNR